MVKRKKLKENKQRLNRLAKESITVESFFANYLGIRDNSLLSSKISHSDIKGMLPLLVRTSFDYIIDNPDVIYNGEVLLVEDSFGSVVPYFNPTYVYEETEFIGEFEEEEQREEIPNINDIEVTELSNYELQNLLHLYERHGIRGAYRKVRNELLSRKDSRHSSKESKERVLRKSLKNERFEY